MVQNQRLKNAHTGHRPKTMSGYQTYRVPGGLGGSSACESGEPRGQYPYFSPNFRATRAVSALESA